MTVLPHSGPEAQGVDPAGVLAFLDELESADDIEMHTMMLVRHGHVVAEGAWIPYSLQRPQLLYSLSKSFTATAVGLAVEEGLLDLDATVLSYFPELADEVTHPGSRSMLVRHAAAMSSGHLQDTLDRAMATDREHPVRGFLLVPPERPPGSVFAYNQMCTYALAAIVTRTSGLTLTEYLRPRLFTPLGIEEVGWQQHPPGSDLGFTGLHAAPDAIARLGMLYLQRGMWEGQRLLSEAWVAEATRAHIGSANQPSADWQQGYGFQFWVARHGYRGDGAYGQFCVVLPEHDAVIALTAATENMQGLLDAVWTHLLPAMAVTPGRRSLAGEELVDRLARLELPALQSDPVQTARADRWDELSFRPAGGLCAGQPSLTDVHLQREGDQWRLHLLESDDRHTVPLGNAGWLTSSAEAEEQPAVPLAATGGWHEDTFTAKVVFLETPHRLDLTCSASEGTFQATWHTVPLMAGRLSQLRKPPPTSPV